MLLTIVVQYGAISVRGEGAGSQTRFSRAVKKFGKPHEKAVIAETNGEEDENHDEVVA